MKEYKGFTPKQRQRNLNLFNRAKGLKLLSAPTKCKFCGQTEGILHTHCEEYGVSLELLPKLISGAITPDEKEKLEDVLWPICWRCHMLWHSKDKHPEAVEYYFKEVEGGKMYPPVFKHNFQILNEHFKRGAYIKSGVVQGNIFDCK